MSNKNKQYGKWTSENMEKALKAVRNGELSLRSACSAYSVPKTTVKRHLAGINKFAVEATKHFGHPVDLSAEMEEQLVQHVLKLEEMMFDISAVEVRKLAYQLAEANAMTHSFNKNKKEAGKNGSMHLCVAILSCR